MTAFTLGHSVTLISGAVGWLRLPSQPVEVLIAISILASAVHAIRPIFARREAGIAGAFGLIHGMAFAGALTELHLDPYRLALAVLGFNLGIEAMQLFVIGVSFPWLVLLAKTRASSIVRVAGASFAAAASIGWIAERALHLKNPMDSLVVALAAHPATVVIGLAIGALGAVMWERATPTWKASSV